MGELGTIGNQSGFNPQFLGYAITVGLDTVLKLYLRLREGNVVRVATGAPGKGLRVARKALAEGDSERADQAVVPLAEVDAFENGGLGIALFGGFGDLEDEGIAANFEGGRIEALRLTLAPVPNGVKDAEAGAAEALAAPNAPIDVGGGSKAGRPGLDLGAALLLQPILAAEFLEVPLENVPEGGEMPDVEGRVV